ncbi:circularly permutated Ras protein 1-like isoform X1 [Scomber scombrus]|uniref:Circularly permutated Ras protein 1-like isoform X1 n=2 Tax=Scomber scombrus TaxID=13677 RepID=A0AAV1NYK2_SCOSC|nr:circularly permutated Ras protein 1-like isoform X1 [Scomber scombrus]XP_062298087.1 circularly permutated Ras protein 1-like isoform X1 [Scomber scombrus]
MEFACGFVYVPPTLSQKSDQRPNVFKRSALLPPVNKCRPRCPPPPPPTTNSAEVKSSKSLPSPPKIIEQLEKIKEVRTVVKSTPYYENAEFHRKSGTASSTSTTPQQTQTTTPPRKTALLPPHMRPAANSQSPPYSQPLPSTNTNNQIFTYDLPKAEPDLNANPGDPNYSYSIPECNGGEVNLPADTSRVPAPTAPPLPSRPSFMKSIPEYVVLLPSSRSASSSSQKSPLTPPISTSATADKGPLPGNPNVVLVSLGKLVSDERVQPIQGKPTSCSQCSSVPDSGYDNMVKVCYFCQSCDFTSLPSIPQSPSNGYQDGLFLPSPDEKPLCAADAMLLFCIDISGSMSLTCQVSDGANVYHRSRLQFVQEAVLQCVQSLSEQQPDIQVGLITFNHQVTMHGYDNFTSYFLSGAELADSDYLKAAAANFPSPPPLSQTKDFLQRQVMGLFESGTTALGPAALLAIAVASKQPGSKVIICTDGKANTDLGNLEVEDDDACTLLSSTVFYQDLGEYAANQGVTVSVLSIEGTDCRLDELGRLADRTGGTVVITSPNRLHQEFEQIIENRTIATHCTVTLLLPKALRVKGEREAGHKVSREVGNVDPNTEITFQFGAYDHDAEVPAPASGSRVSIQLQICYRERNGRTMLRVFTTEKDVTDDSSAALSSLSLSIIQLNSSQASAALAVRGRFLDARKEGELQRELIERAIENNRNAEDKQTYQEWVKTMEPIYNNNIHNFTRRKSVVSDSQSLTDAGAALLYTMKHSNRKSISLKKKHNL